MDRHSDAALQSSIELLWRSTLALIEEKEQRCSQYELHIPYTQGLLFGVLLFKQPAIQGMIADRSGKFTVLFADPPAKMENLLDESIHKPVSKKSRQGSLEKRASNTLPSEISDYLKKFLEISEKMLLECKNKRRDFTISAIGYDRKFFKSALFHHYPRYIASIASKQTQIDYGILHIHLKKDVPIHSLSKEISKLKDLVKMVEKSSIHYFRPLSSKADPIITHYNPLFKEGQERVFGCPSADLAICSSSPFLLSDMSHIPPSLSKYEGIKNEKINSVVQQITERCMESLDIGIPTSTKSARWKKIWKNLDSSLTLGLDQSKIRELVSLKYELGKASFEPLKYLNANHKELQLSKIAQMKLDVSEDEIQRSIYPDAVLHPANIVLVNGKELPFKSLPWSREIVLSYYRVLLANLLDGQKRYDEETVEQLLSGLFLSQENLHPAPCQDLLIISLIKSVTFGFGGNVRMR